MKGVITVKNVLITGIGGLTPRSIARRIRKTHPEYRLIGCDVNPKAIGFFMDGLLDAKYVCQGVTRQTISAGLKSW